MATRSSRRVASCWWVWPPLECSSTTRTNVMVSNMHVTHITFTLWIHIRLSCLWFRQVEKNAFLWLHVLSTFCGQEEVLRIWGWFLCIRNSTPTNKLIFMLALRFFQFSNFGSNWGIMTSSHKHIPFTNHLHVRVHLADIP